MAFEGLSGKLQNLVNSLKGKARITENDIKEISKQVKLALLEADVNYKVVKDFTNKVKEKALGEEVKKSLKPDEVFIKLVKDELISLLGNDYINLETSKKAVEIASTTTLTPPIAFNKNA